MRAVVGVLGSAMVVLPSIYAPVDVVPAVVVGLVAVATSMVGRWPWTGSVAAAVAVAQLALDGLSRATAVSTFLAGGVALLVAAYLLALDLLESDVGGRWAAWLRGEWVAGVGASLVVVGVLALAALPLARSVWLVLLGMLAVVGAVALASYVEAEPSDLSAQSGMPEGDAERPAPHDHRPGR